MYISKEKKLVDKILSEGLIPIIRYGSFTNYNHEDFFEEDSDKDLYGDDIIHFKGCFACMSGTPLSSSYCGFGFNEDDNDLFIGGIKPNAKIIAQHIDDNDDDHCYSWGLWQIMEAKDFYEEVKEHGKRFLNNGLSHETLKNQCIVNCDDIEYVERIDILNFLEKVEDIKYKLLSNGDIIARILKGLSKDFKMDLYNDFDKFEEFVNSFPDII